MDKARALSRNSNVRAFVALVVFALLLVISSVGGVAWGSLGTP